MSFSENVLTENLTAELAELIINNSDFDWREIEEIRLRTDRPIYIKCHRREYVLRQNGVVLKMNKRLIERSALALAKSSFYAFEEEMRQGFITIAGGHRIGLCGETVLENGTVKTLKNISSINFRFAREIAGAAQPLLKYIYCDGIIRQSLLAAPPGVGKTTVLRDIGRIFGSGDGVPAINVGIADERLEIAGSYLGVPQLEVGKKTDVISGCSKAEGVMMLIRSMTPRLILTDEIGRKNDAEALMDAMNCGVKVIATAHGNDYEELQKRPVIRDLLASGFFERVIVLGRNLNGSFAKAVYDENGEILC